MPVPLLALEGVVAVPIVVAVLGFLGLAYQARINRDTARGSSIDTRAQDILDRAMSWQDATIHELRGRIDVLEDEVSECEVGRARDRDRYDRELDALRSDVGRLQGGAT